MKHFNQMSAYLKSLDSRIRLYLLTGTALLLLSAVLLSAANGKIAGLTRKRASREADLVQMTALKDRYLSARVFSSKFGNRIAAVRADDTPAGVVEEIGIKGKSIRITPLKAEQREGFLEDVAEVKLDAISANEAVNLLYRIENGSRPVLVKRALFKTRFDDTSRLDLTLGIALLKPSSQGQR